jgi:hypothetical protein
MTPDSAKPPGSPRATHTEKGTDQSTDQSARVVSDVTADQYARGLAARAAKRGQRLALTRAKREATVPGVFYVLHCDDAIKVGIYRVGSDRLIEHVANGWDMIHLRHGITLGEARAIEREVIDAWRANGVPWGVAQGAMEQGGHTETAPGSRADALTLADWDKSGRTEPVPMPSLTVEVS